MADVCCVMQPHIRIWDSVSLATQRIIGTGEFDRAVTCLAFSKAVSFLDLDLRSVPIVCS